MGKINLENGINTQELKELKEIENQLQKYNSILKEVGMENNVDVRKLYKIYELLGYNSIQKLYNQLNEFFEKYIEPGLENGIESKDLQKDEKLKEVLYTISDLQNKLGKVIEIKKAAEFANNFQEQFRFIQQINKELFNSGLTDYLISAVRKIRYLQNGKFEVTIQYMEKNTGINHNIHIYLDKRDTNELKKKISEALYGTNNKPESNNLKSQAKIKETKSQTFKTQKEQNNTKRIEKEDSKENIEFYENKIKTVLENLKKEGIIKDFDILESYIGPGLHFTGLDVIVSPSGNLKEIIKRTTTADNIMLGLAQYSELINTKLNILKHGSSSLKEETKQSLKEINEKYKIVKIDLSVEELKKHKDNLDDFVEQKIKDLIKKTVEELYNPVEFIPEK